MSGERSGEDLGHWAAFRADLGHGWRKLSKRTSPSHKRLVMALVLVGVALRVARLWSGITYDEAFTWTAYASQPLSYILEDRTWPNNHILHSILAKASTGLFGVHLWSLRLPALLAGILAMPLFYVFVRLMFNRYIAALALAFVASSGVLIEYGAMARGYSLCWLFMVAALLSGRHFAKGNSLVSALLTSLFCALGMWAVPSMIYAAVTVYAWMLLYLMSAYETSLGRRMLRLGISFAAFALLGMAAYAPVVVKHSLVQLLHHPLLGDNSWSVFVQTHQDRVFGLWAFFNDRAATVVSVLGFVGLFYAAYVSTKYRVMVLAILIGSVPLVILQRYVAEPEAWAYTLFLLHLSSAMALFYLLKFMQARVLPSLGKRTRNAVACALVLVGMGWLGIREIGDRVPRYDDVARATTWLGAILEPGDRVVADRPIDAPFEFLLATEGLDRAFVRQGPAAGHRLFVLVGPSDKQTVESVMATGDHWGIGPAGMVKVKDWKRLEIFAAP